MNMAVLIAKKDSLAQHSDLEIKIPTAWRSVSTRKRKLILSDEDDEGDNANPAAGGKLCEDMRKSEFITYKRCKDQSIKNIMEDKASSAEVGKVEECRERVINLGSSLRSKRPIHRRFSGRHPCLSEEENGFIIAQQSEVKKDKEHSPSSSSTTKSAIGPRRISIDFEAPMDKGNPTEKKTVHLNACGTEKGTSEGKKVMKHVSRMKKEKIKSTDHISDVIEHSHNGRTSDKKHSEKVSDPSVNKKVFTSKSLNHGKGNESDEDWAESRKRKSAPKVAPDVEETKTIENSGNRRLPNRRRSTSSKKYYFENFAVGDWIDDEEDMALYFEESTVNSDSNHLTWNGESSAVREKKNIEDITGEDDIGKLSVFNSSPSSSSSSLKSAPIRNRKSVDRSTHRKNNVNKKEPPKCHQCQRSDRRIVVPCTNCKEKVYCIQCIKEWYPNLLEEEVSETCPFCRRNCNCSLCLHTSGIPKTSHRNLTDDKRVQYLLYFINLLLPFLKQVHEEQLEELETESCIQGIPAFSVDVEQSVYHADERVFCNHCSTSIIDLHRSWPKCSYELCLSCCREIRRDEGSVWRVICTTDLRSNDLRSSFGVHLT